MLYVIYTESLTNYTENKYIFSRTSDLARLQLLQDQGRLLTAGLTPRIDCYDPGKIGFNGYTVIAEFDSLESAQAWIKKNPYIATNNYTKVIVRPYIILLP
ncbi:YciI family protein [Candidatus Palibaumannia cicadellinicola]|uniref:YCII-related domain-containing protein n=1 Tax=Baumannia cicadellinicola subsp. Homalodisca coagulata TaxID=374463 RepID=Q1LTG1_BAUCH|nr:YciI family protein [Candidatus Baumannia cicadellinicola]ABF14248.1 conserved hypothetical protein [Baumannia cicadellinicola str. Hc (Homalodisca coagulata)]MCJ7462264.1 YciI family protein [Candidatus Baumannia cicadellinicola]MCJ7462554.1 YciI family protein [Candidatus Baumannia cicadellinicola]